MGLIVNHEAKGQTRFPKLLPPMLCTGWPGLGDPYHPDPSS
jgi:hypothetical protein